MVQQALEAAGICSVRVDGNVSISNRQKALKQFNDDPETRVILLTISCGAVGYAASITTYLAREFG